MFAIAPRKDHVLPRRLAHLASFAAKLYSFELWGNRIRRWAAEASNRFMGSELDLSGNANPKQKASFIIYDEQSKESFAADAQRVLDHLRARFQRVEVHNVRDAKGDWCVRIVRASENDATPPLPLAAIGRTPHAAAERLWRMSTFF